MTAAARWILGDTSMGLDAHIEWLRDQIHKAAPTYVVFETTDGERVSLTVTKGGSDFESDQQDEYACETNTIDFLVNPNDLPRKPRAGDKIEELDDEGGNVIATYLIVPEAGVNAWEWAGQSRKMMRIHTKQVGDE